MGPTNRTPVRGAARLAAILDALPDALVLVDDSGAIVNANAAALSLFEGESAERLLGRPITGILPGIGRAVATPGSGPAALPAGTSAIDPRDLVGGVGGPVRRPPERMAARRTDGGVFPAEVTTAELIEADESELTLLVVRDLTGVLDVEAELRRQQRQIELILRAAAEGIIGVDHEGRIVLVNPAGAKILRYRAAEMGGQNVHDLLTHSRADGTPLPESESPLLDSVRTGAKHRAVDCVLWRNDGGAVYVDLTTAPVYEGENIIGAVMTFVDNSAARAAARQAAELTNVLDKDLRGALVDVALRLREVVDHAEAEYAASGHGAATLPMLDEVGADLEQLATLAADVVDFQQSVLGNLEYEPETAALLGVVDAAVSAVAPAAGAAGVEIAAHCSDVEVDLDVTLFVKLLAHLLADMVSVSPVGGKIVVTAARRGTLARIEIRGPHTGGGPLHLPIAQAIAARHGGTVTTHRIAGKGNTHVVEVPVSQPNMPERPARPKAAEGPVRPALPTRVRRGGQRPNAIAAANAETNAPTAGRRPTASPKTTASARQPGAVDAGATGATGDAAGLPDAVDAVNDAGNEEAAPDEQPAAESPQTESRQPSRRRRPAPNAADPQARIPAQSRSSLNRPAGAVGSIADLRPSRPMPTGDVWSKPDRALTSEPAPPQLEPLEQAEQPRGPEQVPTAQVSNAHVSNVQVPNAQVSNSQAVAPVEVPAPPIPEAPEPVSASAPAEPVRQERPAQPAQPWLPGEARPVDVDPVAAATPVPEPRPAQSAQPPRQPAKQHVQPWQLTDESDEEDDAEDATQRMPQMWQLEPVVAQPPTPQPASPQQLSSGPQQTASAQQHAPAPQFSSTTQQAASAPQPASAQQSAQAVQPRETGQESAHQVPPVPPEAEQMQPPSYVAATHAIAPRGRRRGASQDPETAGPPAAEPQTQSAPEAAALPERTAPTQPVAATATQPVPTQPAAVQPVAAQPTPAAQPAAAEPVRRQLQPVAQPLPPTTTQYQSAQQTAYQPAQQTEHPSTQQAEPRTALPAPIGYAALPERAATSPSAAAPTASAAPTTPTPTPTPTPTTPDAAEPEAEVKGPRLLLWPDPDEETNLLLRERGYEPVALGQPSRLATLAANGTGEPHPFAVFVDPISAPITRRGLREVRAGATKAGLALLVTAGIERATDADGGGLGPDPALLLTALLPAEVRGPRVLLVEARPDLGDALAETLERQGMRVTHATTDAESREAAVASPPDLVLLDLMQIRRRRVGVVDWLRDRGLLARTPLVVYTAEGSDTGGLESLYLTERATDADSSGRLGDLLSKIAP